MKEIFMNSKLHKLYEAFQELFPNTVGWQDIGEEGEMICIPIKIQDAVDSEIIHSDVLWISEKDLTILGHLEKSDENFITINFEK